MGSWRVHVLGLLAYAAVALLFSWPLPLRLTTFLPGPPDGDAGVYVWNQWVFHRELVVERSDPFTTSAILSSTGPVSLSLHNYTELPNLLALPLIDATGQVAAFNLVYLTLGVLTAYATFLLVRAVTPGVGGEAWLAGVLFAWSPTLVARGATHLSLTAAGALPLFLLGLIHAGRTPGARSGILLGVTFVLAAWSDAYYAIYCGLLAVTFLATSALTVERRADRPRRVVGLTADVLVVLVLALMTVTVVTGGWAITVGEQLVSFRSLYTPALVLTLLLAARLLTRYRVRLTHVTRDDVRGVLRIVGWASVACAVLLAPRIAGLIELIVEGRFSRPPVFWRSSPPGIDLLALAVPNPNHPLVPDAWRAWLGSRPNGFVENVASAPLVAALVLGFAWRHGWRPPRFWTVTAIGFLALAVGPFLRVGGFNTALPGPWALLRYVPGLELARMPTRLFVVVLLALAVLFAMALVTLRARHPARARFLLMGTGMLLFTELWPVPRTLSSAGIPAIYEIVAADPRAVRVLELPFGVRDGTKSFGNFSARTQYYQTAHGKPILGGYLSRISDVRVELLRSEPVLETLLRLGAGESLAETDVERLSESAPLFAARMRLGYVVIDRRRTPHEATKIVIQAFGLEPIASSGDLELYRPAPVGPVGTAG